MRRVKQSMMENGLERFYWTNARFRGRINFRIEKGENRTEPPVFEVLNLEQLSFFFVLYAIQMAIAIIIFILELIVHRLTET